MLELSAITDRFKTFIAGASGRSELESWIADQVITVTPTYLGEPVAVPPDQILAYSIGESFCALQGDDEKAAHFAPRILSCLEQVLDVEDVQDPPVSG